MNFVEQIVNFNQEVLGIEQRVQSLIPANEAQISIESLIEEANELREAFQGQDFIKAVDAVADTLFFAVGVMYKFGLSQNQIVNAILAQYNARLQHPMCAIYECDVEVNEHVGFPEDQLTLEYVQSIEDFVDEFSKHYELNDMVNSVTSIALVCRACCAIFGEFGLSAYKAERVMDAVYTANMTKKKGVNAKRGDGQAADAVKPADFVPPEEKIAEILGMAEKATQSQ